MEFHPIIPPEPVLFKQIPDGTEWLHQVKWDGVRILTYYDGKEVRLFNRRLNERTDIFPELKDVDSYTTATSVIFDGEVIALDEEGKPSFHEVMRRDGIRSKERALRAVDIVPITYMIFDVIFCNGQWLDHEELDIRLAMLSKIVRPNGTVRLVSSYEDGFALFDAVCEQGLEGIVSKRRNSEYPMRRKDPAWRKIKYYKDLIAVIGGVTFRSGIVNALLLGLYNERDQLIYIGHAGTGKLTSSDWVTLTRKLIPLQSENRPFFNLPERTKGAQWLIPKLTAKIQYQAWTSSGSLRQPSIQAIVDQNPEKCRLNLC
ncbi:DNA ligase [Sporolactobacillus shoreae]|uniref:DNA ligase (ATP) n=1 Tax=Sporolactobacillus shoreae TaxID=1465501 RepID=A0A4Z0GRZ4_9BACL|nr:RNA ligase family protein [Sporolactobacillus shoreae]TGA99631.1 DNA ligase [Sporolactobacillus shoreae]